jgi:hypothetical protein
MSKEQALREAEAFIRRAVARTSNRPISEKKIRAAAEKVVRSLPVEEVA